MKKKILIVEDDSPTRYAEKRILESGGYDVLETDNPKQGVEIAIKEIPALIIMDIRLPNKKRGIGAAKIIRDNAATCDTPIIFVTGYLEGKEASEIKNISNCGFIGKPFEASALLNEIKNRIG